MKLSELKHPMQPIGVDEQGVLRFKENAIIRFLIDWGRNRGMSLNDLALLPFSNEDRDQLAQLIGYSVCGYSELGYVMENIEKAEAEADRITDLLEEEKKHA